MKILLEKLLRAESLDLEDSHRLFDGLIRDTPPEMKAALLSALRAKKETETEILGMAQQMRKYAVALPPRMQEALDTCGTGGDGSRTLNLSTLSALLLSSMGVPIVKHGNRSVSSACGSADLLEGLGFPLDLTPDQAVSLFDSTRFAFLFAPLYHPVMKSVAAVRKALQIRTIFNFLGPLSNPAKVLHQVVGVPEAGRVRPFAEVLKLLGLKSAMVVHGEPGMDEISPCGKTQLSYFLDKGPIRDMTVTMEDLGCAPIRKESLTVNNIAEAVARARRALEGKGAEEDMTAVSVNAAAGLFITGKVKHLADGVSQARTHLAQGLAHPHFNRILQAAAKL